MSRPEVNGLIAATNAFVSLHRSEGFGFGLAEAMLLGKPAIGTDYSGNTDFLNRATGYPVPYELVPVGSGEYPDHEGQVWAEPRHCARRRAPWRRSSTIRRGTRPARAPATPSSRPITALPRRQPDARPPRDVGAAIVTPPRRFHFGASCFRAIGYSVSISFKKTQILPSCGARA